MLGNFSLKLKKIRQRELLWDSISTTIFGAIGKAVGFLVPFFIARWFGATSETDAFFFGYGLIIFMATIFSPVVESIIVPFIAEERARGKDVGSFVGTILTLSAILMTALSIIFVATSGSFLRVITNFTNDNINLIQIILFESSPLLILLVWTSIIAGSLNAFRSFKAPAISPAIRAAATIFVTFLLKDKIGVHAIAFGYVVGEVVRLIMLFYALKRSRFFALRFTPKWEPNLKSFIGASSLQIVGMTMLAFVPTVNKAMASWLGPGNVSMLEYADRIYMIPVAFVSTGVLVTLLSHCSRVYSENGVDDLKRNIHHAAKVVAAIGIVVTGGLLLIKNHIVTLVYHDAVSPDRLTIVNQMLTYYFLAITPYLLTQVYIRGFLIMKNMKMLLFAAVFFSAGLFAFNSIFIRIIGLQGFAISYLIQSVLALAVLMANFGFVGMQIATERKAA